MFNRFNGYRQIESNDNISHSTLRKPCDFFKNLFKSREREQKYEQNMQELSDRLSKVGERLKDFIRDSRYNNFGGHTPESLRNAYNKMVKHAQSYKDKADKASDKASKYKYVSGYENNIKYLEKLCDELRDHIDGKDQLNKRISDVGKRLRVFVKDPRSQNFAEMRKLQDVYKNAVKYDDAYRKSDDDAYRKSTDDDASRDQWRRKYEGAIEDLEELHNQLGDHVYKDEFVIRNGPCVKLLRTNKKDELEIQAWAPGGARVKKIEERVVNGSNMICIRLKDYGFVGLVSRDDLEKVPMKRYHEEGGIGDVSPSKVVVITTPKLRIPLYQNATGDATLPELYAGDTLSLIEGEPSGDRIPVALSRDKKGYIENRPEDFEIRDKDNPSSPKPNTEKRIKYAQAFLAEEVKFKWGGTSPDGVDSSGFIKLISNLEGLTDMPRHSTNQCRYLINLCDLKSHADLNEFYKMVDTHELIKFDKKYEKPNELMFRELSENEETMPGDLIIFLQEFKKKKEDESFYLKEDGSFYHSPYHVTIAKDKYNIIHAVGAPDTLPRFGVIESCLPNCNENHDGHDPGRTALSGGCAQNFREIEHE